MEQRNEIQIHFKKQLCGNILYLFNIVHVVEGKIYPIVPTFISNFSIKKREIPFFTFILFAPCLWTLLILCSATKCYLDILFVTRILSSGTVPNTFRYTGGVTDWAKVGYMRVDRITERPLSCLLYIE